ncbi:hypothetical protein Tco_1077883 [Tanacetum coccineum]
MESSNSNSKERELQLTQRLAKQRHSHCMAWFEQLETHLRDLYLNSSSHVVDAFKPAFHSFFGEEHQTFRVKMFRNLDQLRLQLERENLLEVNPRSCLEALRTQRDLLETLDTLEAVIHRAVITYDRLQLQSQDVQINPVQVVDDRFSVSKSSWIESINNNALNKLVNESELQQHESLVTESTKLEANLSMDVNALDVGLAVTEEKVDSNTTPNSKNMSHRGGEIDQDAEQDQVKNPLLNTEFLKTSDMVEKEVHNELSNIFLQLEKHCISLEISMQQKEESFQSNKPEARKKTQERNRNSKPNVIHTISLQNTTNGSKPNPRSNNQISRILPVSKSSCGMSNGVSLVDHSRNSSSFCDSKHFVFSTCHKCVFNANHDNCITKFLKEVNSRAKDQSPKTRNNNKPLEPKSHTQKPGRQIAIKQRFSLNKSFAVHEKPNTPRSCLRWIPTGRIFKLAGLRWIPTSRIFKLVGLRWIPTGKMFIDSITKVDSEPPNGSNEDITNPYECNQTLNVSAGTLNLSAGTSFNPNKEKLRVWLPKRLISHKPGLQGIQI